MTDAVRLSLAMRVCLALAVVCIVSTMGASVSMLASANRTEAAIERLILHGPGAHAETIMHHVTLGRRDGKTLQVEVGGTASATQVMDAIAAFMAGDTDPEGWKVTTWTIAGGGTIKVSTPPNRGESTEDHCARHDAFVDELQDRFPPVD